MFDEQVDLARSRDQKISFEYNIFEFERPRMTMNSKIGSIKRTIFNCIFIHSNSVITIMFITNSQL